MNSAQGQGVGKISLSLNPPILGGKVEGKMGHETHTIFFSHFLSSPIFSPTKQGKMFSLTPFPSPFSFLFHFPPKQAA